jgi:hypothetical protein
MKIPMSLLLAGALGVQATEVSAPIPSPLKDRLGLAPFYGKCVMVGDFPIVSSPKVSDAALLEAATIVRSMLDGRDDILTAMAKNEVRLVVMAVSERTCDVPEHSDLKPRTYWNVRARGLGASKECPVVSCGEENLLCSPGDRYPTENIMVHEFAHAIHDTGLKTLDATFDRRLKETHQAAIKAGKWKNCYAAENHHEYWAEAVQSWFGTNRENDAIHNHVNTRDELVAYDPELAKLCEETFRKNTWQYRRADDAARKDEVHLKDLDRSKLSPFVLTKEEQDLDRREIRKDKE